MRFPLSPLPRSGSMVAFTRMLVRAVLSVGACVFIANVPARATEEPATRPTLLKAQVPEYPAGARRREEEGTVHVRVQVLASGRTGEVRVQKSSGAADLDRAAVAAVKASEFRAAQGAAGEPVESWVVVPYKFVLMD
jgi:protein TonB